jgi:hypothetical protein
MLRTLLFVLLVPFVFGASVAGAQAKKGPVRTPTDKDKSVAITVFMRDGAKNELLIATRVWPEFPDYNALALQRFFGMMKSMEPPYRQDDDVAYSWQQKAGKITKCSIYLESADAGTKGGTGAIVGCEANGVSSVPVPSLADPKKGPSLSSDPKHLADVMDLFKKQQERAKASAGAK